MKRFARVLPWCLAACAALAAGDPTPKDVSFETGWDKPVDPDADCRFIHDKGVLTIQLPGRHHDLVAEHEIMNAPRLLRDVEGDFTAQVRVDGYFRPTIASTFGQAVPFLGAGLIVMASDKIYARLERAALYKNEQFGSFVLWELRVDSKVAASKSPNFTPSQDKALSLRLQRKGNRLLASVSQDGDQWTELESMEVKLPAKVKVGVSACTTSEVRFKPRYDAFRLKVSD